MTQLPIPDQFADLYRRAAAHTYQYIGDDVESLPGPRLSRKDWIEIIRDANYISSYVKSHPKQFTPEFTAWLVENEYNQQFKDAMDKAVGGIL
jgi:hypothetical protein